MKLIAIAAMTESNIIAISGQMPWNCKADMKHFKAATIGFPVIMGRKTFEDMGGKPLSNRYNIVMSHRDGYQPEGTKVVSSVRDAISAAYRYCELNDLDQAYVIGGENIYKQFAPHVDYATLSVIDDIFVDRELIELADRSGRGLVVNYFPMFAYGDVEKKFIHFV